MESAELATTPAVYIQQPWRPDVDDQTKHEIWIIAATTLAAVPLLAGLGFAAITGLIAM
jgi:hypothetical protein